MHTVQTFVTGICDIRPNPWGFIVKPGFAYTDMRPDVTLATRRRYKRSAARREAERIIRETFAA